MAIRYISEFTNEIGADFKIEILDSTYTGSATELICSGECSLRTVDGDFDQTKPIRAQELSVGFVNTGDSLTLEDFVTEDERRFVVKLYHDTELAFVGYLVQDGIQELMVSYASILRLTFTDGIAFLRNEELTTPLGLRPFGRERITNFIGYILHKLNPDITTFRIYCSLRETTDDASTNIFHQKMLDWYTFEKDGGSNVDCYDALELLMGAFSCTFFQRSGVWNIVYYPDLINGVAYMDTFTFTVDANNIVVAFVGRESELYLQAVGTDELVIPTNEDQISRALQAAGTATVIYRHERPVDVPKNSKPEFGEPNNVGDEGPRVKGYNIDYWQVKQGAFYEGNPPAPPSAQLAYWQKVSNAEGYEVERRFRLAPTLGNGALPVALESRPIEVSKDEVMTISLAHRCDLAGNFSGGTTIAAVKLLGVDGSIWWLGPNGNGDGAWLLQSSLALPIAPFVFTGNGQRDIWKEYSQRSAPFPIDGQVIVYLGHDAQMGASVIAYFKNLQVDVRTAEVTEEEFIKKRVADLVKRGFRSRKSRRRGAEEAKRDFRDFIQLKVKGEKYTYGTGQNFKLKEENEVRVGVSAKRAIKGSLFRADAVTLCSASFTHALNAFAGTFGQISARTLATYTTRNYRVIEGSFKGYNYGDAGNNTLPRLISFHTSFKFPQYEPFTGFKWYCLVGFDINFISAIGKLTFTEMKHNTGGGILTNGGTLTYSSEYIYE